MVSNGVGKKRNFGGKFFEGNSRGKKAISKCMNNLETLWLYRFEWLDLFDCIAVFSSSLKCFGRFRMVDGFSERST